MSPRTKEQFEEIRDNARERIMSAALELFGTKGYEATPISEIARRAGYSKGLLYNYFEGKEDLLKQLIASFNEKGDNIMQQVIHDDPATMLESIIRFTFNEFRNNMDIWKLITSLSVQIERFEFVHDLAIKKFNDFSALFEHLLTGIGVPNPKEEARVLCALFDGIGMQRMFMREDYHLDTFEEYLITKYCKQ